MAEKTKTALALMGLSLFAIIIMELLARGAIWFRDSRVEVEADPRADLASLEDASFDPDLLFREFHAIDKAYQPYILWSRKPFNGVLTNIDSAGNRLTLYNSSKNDALQLWMFGGSTTWGTGAPDGETISSHLAWLINQHWGVDAQIRNLGETGYVSTQEVIFLLRELQRGFRPNVVIFYDGVNDASAAALWPRSPGTHHNLTEIQKKFEQPRLVDTIRSLGIYRVANYVSRRLGPTATTVTSSEAYVSEAANRAIDIWFFNHDIVTALAKEFGFVEMFVFQPSLGVGEKPLHPSEENLLSQLVDKPAAGPSRLMQITLKKLVGERLRKQNAPRTIHDYTDLFSDVTEPIYIDGVHITGNGNRIVAEKLFLDLKSTLCERSIPSISVLTSEQLTIACK